MQRPTMDPTFMLAAEIGKNGRRRGALRRWVISAGKWFWRWLLTNPFRAQQLGEERVTSLCSVLVRTTVCWSILLPVILMLCVLGLVFKGTHPSAVPIIADPTSQGCFYQTVNFTSSDGTALSGWLVPAIDARRVLEEKDRVVRKARPGMVLVHDFGQSPQQLLALVRPLHDEGIVVLLVALRGSGGAVPAGQTFGVRESSDVEAAVELLRASPLVDPARIAIGGIGTGANAALIAAAHSSAIKALVLANPLRSSDDAIAARIAPHKQWLRWLRPLCRRTFELCYGVDSQQANYDQYAPLLKSHPSLVFNNGDSFVLNERATAKQVIAFCRRNLHTQDLPLLGSSR